MLAFRPASCGRPALAEAWRHYSSDVTTEALQLIGQDAIVARADEAAYRLSLGQVHSATSRLEDAVAAYRQATELAPDLADAWFGLGVALQAANRQQEAIAVYRRLLASSLTTLTPATISPAHWNFAGRLERGGRVLPTCLGAGAGPRGDAQQPEQCALFRCGRLEEAIAAGRRAMALEPDSAMACNNLGCALTAARQLTEAVDVLRRAIALRPDFAEAWYNLANALREQGKYDEAAAACRGALALRPDRRRSARQLGKYSAGRGST